MTPLPIDERIEEIVSTAQRAPTLLLEAPPGAGKTTRVPAAFLSHEVSRGQLLVLQPRRIATRLAARRVAQEMGEPVGRTVGYQVRFEEVAGPKTRLLFLTEGVLERRLLSNPRLDGIGLVAFDEFHERSLAGDVCLALLRRLQRGPRPDLKIAVMSATIDVEAVAAYLDPCAVLKVSGRRFDVEVEYLPAADPRPLEEQVLAGVKKVHAGQRPGHILVFLPGAGEIRRTAQTCEDFARRHGWVIRPLHGELPAAEQDVALAPSRDRKLILSTNVAETSVTIEAVGSVIDSGLARVAWHSPWSGLPTLRLQKISKASAVQRGGRAGRTQTGYCLRLYTEADFRARPEYETPEIRRADLSETLIALHAMGIGDLSQIPFFEAPPLAAVQAAELLLKRLGAIDASGTISPVGQKLVHFPLHPRLGRLLLEAHHRGVGEDGALLAALIGERDIRVEARVKVSAAQRAAARAMTSGPSDLLEAMDRFHAASPRFLSSRLQELGLDPAAVRRVDQVQSQLTRLVDARRPRPARAADAEEALLISTLAAYPDRVAKRRRRQSRELLLCEGGQALLSETSVVVEPDLMVAVDAEEQRGSANARALVRVASKVEPEWLLELAPEELGDVDRLEWNPQTEQVERVQRLSYGQVVLEEKRTRAPPSPEASALLSQAAISAPLDRFVDKTLLEDWEGRLELLRHSFPDAAFNEMSANQLRSSIAQLAPGATSFDDVVPPRLLDAWAATLTPRQTELFRSMTPGRVALPSGRQTKVHYARGKPPWVESRMQDFFGAERGPTILGGRVALVMHLLAPNGRAVQVTSDLAGFWDRHYPSIRRELSRKYPRHSWPEDPRRKAPR